MNDRALDVKLAVLEQRTCHIDEQVDALRHDIVAINSALIDMQRQADRWKVGFVVIAGLGGVIGWVLSSADTIARLWRK